MNTCSKGFSIVKTLIIVAVVAAVGTGGYFAYSKYIAPNLNPYAKFIPVGLQKIEYGKTADSFLILKKDQEITNFLKKLPIPADINDSVNSFEGGVILIGSDNTGAVFLQFTNEASAKKVYDLAFAQNQVKEATQAYPLKQNGNILIIGKQTDLDKMKGPFLENPGLGNLDPLMADKQIIAFFDNTKHFEINQSLFGLFNSNIEGLIQTNANQAAPSATPETTKESSFIPKAQAQGFLSPTDNPSAVSGATGGASSPETQALQTISKLFYFLKNTTVYLGLKNNNFDSRIAIALLNEKEIPDFVKMMNEKYGKDTIGTLDKALADYKDSMQQASLQIPELQKKINQLLPLMVPNLKINLNLSNSIFTVAASYQDIGTLLESLLPSVLGAPLRARNAARKAAINSIVAVIETYNSDNGKYPQTSSCLESLTELNKYFYKNTPSKDPQGSQSFGSITCSSGYYYQTLPNNQYIVWSKVEDEKDGNFDLSPSDVEQQIKTGTLKLEKLLKGIYYISPNSFLQNSTNGTTDLSNNAGTSEETSQSAPAPKKVPRVKTTTTATQQNI